MALTPMLRMAERTARAVVLDNAVYFGELAGRCDISRPLQHDRHLELKDLQAQQLDKADALQARIKADASARKDGDSRAAVSRPAETSRWRADVSVGVHI